MKYKKLGMILAGLLVVGALTACGGDSKDKTEDGKSTEQTAEEKEAIKEAEEKGKQTAEELNVKDDEEIKAELAAEEGVESSNVTLMDGEEENYVLVDVTLVEGSEVDFQALSDKYGNMLKEKYPDRVVDVKVTKGTETVSQLQY